VADKEIAWIERIIIARDGHRSGGRYEPAENGEFAPMISVRLSPVRLCQRFKLVNRTLEPHLTLLAQVSAQWVPTAYGRGALWSNARPRVLEVQERPLRFRNLHRGEGIRVHRRVPAAGHPHI
jgi:hypothetical protein